MARARDSRQIRLDPWAARRIFAGWSVDAVAVAAGVSKRTAYRWAKTSSLETVRIGGYVATYAIRTDAAPIRITDWTKEAQ